MSNHASKNHGCFSSVLHRFLCSGGLPTHPTSDIDSPKKDSIPSPSTTNTNTNNTNMTTTQVGIVARLMGLDSIPNSPIIFMQKSKSLGSLDHFLPNFHIHRRVVSFREHDLGKSDMGLTPTQQKSNNNMKIKKMKNIINNTTTSTIKKQRHGVKVKKEKEEVSTTSVPLKMRRKRLVVVDDGFPDHAKKYKNKSRVKSRCNRKHDDDHIKKEKKRSMKLKTRETDQEYCIKVLNEVCRLTMVELQGGVWMNNNNNIVQDISYEIGQQILQLLVYEIVDELCTCV